MFQVFEDFKVVAFEQQVLAGGVFRLPIVGGVFRQQRFGRRIAQHFGVGFAQPVEGIIFFLYGQPVRTQALGQPFGHKCAVFVETFGKLPFEQIKTLLAWSRAGKQIVAGSHFTPLLAVLT
ncbi:hypothetical protein [Kingella oralis]|uniref:hypothetical protein n=1 Tax=Kingella oralis TaxID=505 RepID=UPI003F732C89